MRARSVVAASLALSVPAIHARQLNVRNKQVDALVEAQGM